MGDVRGRGLVGQGDRRQRRGGGTGGAAGIGKSRLTRELAAMAADRDVNVFTTFCESHTSQVPFQVIPRLLRAATGVEGLDPHWRRCRVRSPSPFRR